MSLFELQKLILVLGLFNVTLLSKTSNIKQTFSIQTLMFLLSKQY